MFQSLGDYIFNILQLISKDEDWGGSVVCQRRAGPLRMSPRLQLVAPWEAKALGGPTRRVGGSSCSS